MAEFLNLVYVVTIFLVTVAGITFVFGFTGRDDDDDGTDWLTVVVSLVVTLFLGAMIVDLVVTQGMLG